MHHVTIETQYDPASGKYNLAVYKGASNNPSLTLGDPIWVQQRIDEADVYRAKFKVRDEFIGAGAPVHFAPRCRILGELGRIDEPGAPERPDVSEWDSFLVHRENLLKCLREDLEKLSPGDLCAVADIVFSGVETRVEHDEVLGEDRYAIEAPAGTSMHNYACYRLNGGATEKPKTAAGPKMG